MRILRNARDYHRNKISRGEEKGAIKSASSRMINFLYTIESRFFLRSASLEVEIAVFSLRNLRLRYTNTYNGKNGHDVQRKKILLRFQFKCAEI